MHGSNSLAVVIQRLTKIRVEMTGKVVPILCSRSSMMARLFTNRGKGIVSEVGGVDE